MMTRWGALILATAMSVSPVVLPAQVPACTVPTALRSRDWPAPLDRSVTLTARTLALRDALDVVAAAARIRLSWSAELVPLDAGVCLGDGAGSAGDAIVSLLRQTGAAVEPVVAGGELVVLAPVRVRTSAAPVPDMARGEAQLEPVVVTGAAQALADMTSPAAVTVIEPAALAGAAGTKSLAQLLAGSTPGAWLWQQSPASLLGGWASLRGASSFGASAPKIYLDGIEIANPLLIADLDPATIDRIEIIRGPQGAALYGSGALGGVVHVVTRHDVSRDDAFGLHVRSGSGIAASDFTGGSVVMQDHGLALRAGSLARSLNMDVSASRVGEYAPGLRADQLSASARGRLVGSAASIAATARFFARDAWSAPSPLLRANEVTLPGGRITAAGLHSTSDPQSLRQYTLGATATLLGGARWTHVATIGVDGYRLGGIPDVDAAVVTAGDSALLAARGGADRGTLRLSSSGSFEGALGAATLTLGLEHGLLRTATEEWSTLASDGVDVGSAPQPLAAQPTGGAAWRHTTGLLANARWSPVSALHVTGGMRVELSDALAAHGGVAALPTIGATYGRQFADATVKLRAAYGRGIRGGALGIGGDLPVWLHRRDLATLGPETQSGIEAGVDVFLGRTMSLQLTRFDQRASGLVQRVALSADAFALTGGRSRHHGDRASLPREPDGSAPPPGAARAFALQDVGAISNSGWELQSTLTHGRLSLAAALSIVESRVAKLADGYAGDLRVGDRMLEVPARTATMTARWTGERWLASMSASRAFDWVGHDRLSLAADLNAGVQPAPDEMGDWLRSHWTRYDGVTHVNASLWRELRPGAGVEISIENLLDHQRGEPDNATVMPGRTVRAGVRVAF